MTPFTTPTNVRHSPRHRSPAAVADITTEALQCDNSRLNEKIEDAPDKEEEVHAQCLSPGKRAFFLLGFMLTVFFIVWQLKPFERVIDALLPQLNETQQSNKNNQTGYPSSTTATTTTREPFPFQQCSDNATACCNGVDRICDLKVNDVMFATLHNAMATKQDGTFLHPNHLYSLESALKVGYRGFHLQVCNCNGVYQICHEMCQLGARNPTEVFMNLDRFLRENINEILLIQLEVNNEVGEDVDLIEFYQLIKNTTKFIHNLFVKHDDEEDWPTLRAMIQSHKRVILFHHGGPNCRNNECPAGMHYWHKYALETTPHVSDISELEQPKKSCSVHRKHNDHSDEVPLAQTFFAVNNFVSPPNRNTSQIANSYEVVSGRVEACSEKNRNLPVNLVSVDFWHEGNIIEYVQRYNTKRGRLDKYILV